MAKPKKTPRPKAETPKGFRDYFGAQVTQRTQMLGKIAAIYHRYGFDALESAAVETVEALGKFLPDVDRPNDGVFAWQEDAEGDKPGDWLALRYDLTAPLARVYAQHRNDLPMPYRRYAMGPVWRNEKPGPGRFRQFYQCDADTVGAASVAADAEICAMLADCLEEVGIERGDYIVRVNNRKVLSGVLHMVFGFDIADEDNQLDAAYDTATQRDSVLRCIDKFDKVGVDGVRSLLTVGRKDQSGAFIEGVGLSDEQATKVIGFLTAKGETDEETLTNLAAAVGDSPHGESGLDELREILKYVRAGGYGPDRIVIDPSVVRGLGYYTGPVYEAELTFEITNDKGQTVQFGSVAGGGRYDDLVKRFTGQEVPATGVSIGVDRLLAALESKDRLDTSAQGPVVVTVMDRDRMADYQAMVAELRQAGIRAEVYLGNPKNFGNQLKYADKRGSPVAVIEGEAEKAAGMVQIKDLVLGAQIAQNATLEEWRDRPSQYEVPRADLVARVREILELYRSNPTRAQTNALAATLRAGFEAAGAVVVEPPILQPADTLLDLYGEDIRARAYVTSDALRGEQMLRPDFTVPVVQMHMKEGAEPARYTYAGEVFRRQEQDGARANEYVQVGYEVFAREDRAASDAEVFTRISDAMGALPVRAVTGDIGVLMALVEGLETTALRKAALMRHIWRPRRFRALLAQFSGAVAPSPAREALLRGEGTCTAPLVGARRRHEIDARIAALRLDAQAPPIARRDVELIEALLAVRGALPDALAALHDLSVDLPAIAPAVARVAARQHALELRGVDVGALAFEASYGRTSMEYYDGFVFGFRATTRADLPPLATGGRYDALTRRLGGGREIPAVGGVIRPGLMLMLEGAP